MNLELPSPTDPHFTPPDWNADFPEAIPERSNGHGRVRRVPIEFQDGSPRQLSDDPSLDACAPQVYEFESLLVDILARFVNLPADQVDAEIEDALKRISTFLQLERAQLWTRSGNNGDSFKLIHQCMPLECNGDSEDQNPDHVEGVPLGAESRDYLPWLTAQGRRGKSIVFSKLSELPAEAAKDRQILLRYGTRSGVGIPFMIDGEVIGVVSFEMLRSEREWPELLVRRLELMAEVFANATARKRAISQRELAEQALAKSFEEVKGLKVRLEAESDFLKMEIKVAQAHGEIIGQSQSIKRVLHDVEQVAPAECPVLVSGETGTGKELIAQEIHRLSKRKERIMVLVNCAALPTALVESELFGRERGAYTGALTSQVGRFEIANGSTIFLDEVGELSMEVQAKLLRVLQEGEFQRLGSPRNHKVDVRVIAATNRDLAEEVRKGRFREDLYYRLKVFPIAIPPLRERAEDIPLLVFAFMEEFATRMGKKLTKIPRKAMDILQAHSWPGNIRELRNVIEHSVILSSGDTLKLTSLGEAPVREAEPVTLAEAEREHIVKTLEGTGWRIKGPHGAAARLALQPSTLYSRMQKLGIPHRRQKDEMATQSPPDRL
jgi:formate hydrogenlyase transcriptional activator